MHYRAGKYVFEVIEKGEGEDHGAEFMKKEDGAEAADHAGKEARRCVVAETHGQASSRQPEKRGEKNDVQIPLRQGEAHIVLLFAAGLRLIVCSGWPSGCSAGTFDVSSVMFLLLCRPGLALFSLCANKP